ncbi:MAG: FecR family protein [Akkermansiaceae bacterium]|nr:FecR family protein [Akkermansiaceae bacterium]
MKLPFITTLLLAAVASTASADQLRSAELTQVIKDVKVYRGSSSPKAAVVGDKLDRSSSVTTGRRSRAELTFQDDTITRLGQNSVFSFRSGSREVELKQGSILMQVPKNAGGATIRTATVTAAITGTTSMFEYSPNQWVKLITLEGTQQLFIDGREDPIPVPAGSMIIVSLNKPGDFLKLNVDIDKLRKTSALLERGNFKPLPDPALEAIKETVAKQEEQKREGSYLPTKAAIPGPGMRGARGQNAGRASRDPKMPEDTPPPNRFNTK